MMNNKITRIIANTVGLAAVAALGITVYQLGTAPVKENAPKEQTESTGQEEDSMVDVGNSQVESENQPLIQEEGEENQDYTQDTENTVENSLEDSEAMKKMFHREKKRYRQPKTRMQAKQQMYLLQQ